MKKKKKRILSLRTKLTTALLVISLLPLGLFSSISYYQKVVSGNNLINMAQVDMTESLNEIAVNNIERMSTDTAKHLADFLYQRDSDIRSLSESLSRLLAENENDSKTFMATGASLQNYLSEQNARVVKVNMDDYQLSEDGSVWEDTNHPDMSDTIGHSTNTANNDMVNGATFNPIAADGLKYTFAPLYDEATFISLDGYEVVKASSVYKMRYEQGNPTPALDEEGYYIYDWNSDSLKYNSAEYFKPSDYFLDNETILSSAKDITDRRNTFCKAETYWNALQTLDLTTDEEGNLINDIYVSDVIGAYVGTDIIGYYTPSSVEARNDKYAETNPTITLEYSPEEQAYAGMENPHGERFEGIVRWASPVYADGVKVGYVTLALNHNHIMEFVDHITPMAERYTELPSAADGNYAFIWDYQSRSIAHPRHHSIYGFDAETGLPEIPWLMSSTYYELLGRLNIEKSIINKMSPLERVNLLKKHWEKLIKSDENGQPIYDLINDVPTYEDQRRQLTDSPDPEHTPASDLTALGYVGLDGRYLNNAPQCTGWMDLTRDGGSGSLYIFWSGIYKLNTAAAIPYYTGRYAPSEANNYSKIGFGFIAIGSGIDDFTQPALRTNEHMKQVYADSFRNSMIAVLSSTIVFAFIILIVSFRFSAWMSGNIDSIISGFNSFRNGKRNFRFCVVKDDELGEIESAFNSMADSIENSHQGPLSIIDLDKKIIYMNAATLTVLDEKLENIVGKPYGRYSIYPQNTEYDPVECFLKDKEPEIYYDEKRDEYFKGSASELRGNNDEKIGYVIETRNVSENAKRNAELQSRKEQLERNEIIIKKALRRAEEATEAKSAFLANMSHEIRTPLNAIIGFTEIEINNSELPVRTQQNLGRIFVSGKNLLGIINDILDISKIESGQLELIVDEYDTPSIINDTVVMNLVRIGSKPLELKLNLDSNLPGRLFGDDIRVKQIINNLLTNAIKYTHKGEIHLFLGVSEINEETGICKILCSIKDTGIGITPENQEKLFNEYAMVDMSSHRTTEGTGLGLSICKRLVLMMNGRIWVESEYGKGSVFSFEIEQKIADATPIGDEIVNKLISLEYNGVIQSMKTIDFVPMPYGKILVVDDVRTNLDVACGMMAPYRLQVDTALSGFEAIEIVSSGKTDYDLIFMDHMMPEMDGVETVRRIRRLGTDYAKNVTIIALTANALVGSEKMFMQNGFDGFLSKPINAYEMDEILMYWIRDRANPEDVHKAEENFALKSTAEKQKTPLDELFQNTIIENLDIERGVEKFNNDSKVYINMLKSFAKNIPSLLDTLSEFLIEPPYNMESYSINVHGIKSSLYGICANTVGDEAAKLEKKSKERDVENVVNYNPKFVRKTAKLILDINEFIKKADDLAAPPSTEEIPDKINRELLSKILDATQNFNVDDLRELVENELTQSNYKDEAENELAETINRLSSGFEYDEIVSLIEPILNGR